MGWHLDGRVSAVVGTHTHVQTADERILPQGTAYLTDLGMTGSYAGVIGMNKSDVHRAIHFSDCPPRRSRERPGAHLRALIDIDETTGRARDIERVNLATTSRTSCYCFPTRRQVTRKLDLLRRSESFSSGCNLQTLIEIRLRSVSLPR